MKIFRAPLRIRNQSLQVGYSLLFFGLQELGLNPHGDRNIRMAQVAADFGSAPP